MHHNVIPKKSPITRDTNPKFSKRPYTKKRWLGVSSSTPHKGQRSHIREIPRLKRLFLVAIALDNTLQAVICVEGNIFRFQNSMNKSPYPADSSPKNITGCLHRKSVDSTSLQNHLSIVHKFLLSS